MLWGSVALRGRIRSYNCARRSHNLARTTVRPCNGAGRKPRSILAVSKLQVDLQMEIFGNGNNVQPRIDDAEVMRPQVDNSEATLPHHKALAP